MSSKMTAQDNQRIGDILRRVREHRGEEIDDIAAYLRIRPHYLEALENSQYSALPADAYVIGFLRSYALYLGLDGRGAVDQYRREMAGRRARPQLSMPQPMSEGQAPTAALLIGAAVAVVLVYALWYWLSSPETDVAQQPLPMPQTVQEVSAKDAGAAPAEDAGIAVTATSTGAPLQDIAPIIIQPEDAKAQSAETDQNAGPDAAQEEVKPADKNAKQKSEKPSALTATATASGLVAGAATPTTSAVEKTAPPPAGAPSAQADAAKTEAASPPPAPEKEKPKSGLIIRADKESWVLITDSKGVTVFDRTLKAGEVYQVPAGKGYSLTTGNAGGVSFVNNGVELPRLNSSAPVVRAMPLDPDKLKSKLSKQADPAGSE